MMEGLAAPGRMHLALALAGLPRSLGARTLIEHAAAMGFRAVQLDAAHPELRPRDLSRSARRDLAALMRRSGVACSGVDLWAPPAHLLDPARADHAVQAFVQAMAFASELAELTGAPAVLSTALPTDHDADLLVEQADARGVRIADHAWAGGAHARGKVPPDAPLGVGIDPAALLLAGADPAPVVSHLAREGGPGVIAARLSDADGAARVEPGARNGQLDGFAYAIALHTAGFEAPVVLDVRGVPEPLAAASRARERFDA